MKNERTKGFTLIETLIYLALYSIIMTGALVSVYAVFSSSARNQTKAMVQEEGSFIVGKIDWALTGAEDIIAPDFDPITMDGNVLVIEKFDVNAGNPIVISLTGGNITISRGGTPSEVLNNSNVEVSCPLSGCFTHVSGSGESAVNPESLKSQFTLTTKTSDGIPYSQDFMTIKYLRR